MSSDSVGIFLMIGDIWQVVSNSAVFLVLKWFLMLYALVLVADVILLVLLRGVTANLKTQLYGSVRPLISKSTLQRRWEKIMARLDSGNASQYKVAVLEADHLADELLSGSGYTGQNMGERLRSIQPGQIESLSDLQAAHATRNRIVNEPDFSVDHAEALKLLECYRKFFVEMELF